VEQLEPPDAEIVSRLNTAYRKVLVVGNDVFVPPIFSHRSRPYQFNIKQLRLLHFLGQGNNDLARACEQAGVGITYAKNFLKSRDYKQFASEAVQDQAVQDGWTPRRVVLESTASIKARRFRRKNRWKP
jgi:hypothetical protein